MDELIRRQAEQMAASRFADLAASAGVPYTQISQQLLFFLPPDFVHTYEDLFHRAFAGKDDGGINARGQATAEQATIGKATGKGLAGLGGAKRKTFKRYWVIADETAVHLKGRVDRRLRLIARDITAELNQQPEVSAPSCASCGRRISTDWSFCPYDGIKL